MAGSFPRFMPALVLGVSAIGCGLTAGDKEGGAGEVQDALAVDTGKTFNIVGVASGKCVQAAGGSTADGAREQIASCNSSTAQHFRFSAATAGYYTIANVASGKCLDISGWQTGDGAVAIQYACSGGANQQFAVQSAAAGVRLVARHSGKVLDVFNQSKADGTKLVQWKSNGGTNQQFNLVAVADGGNAPAGYKLVWSDEFDADGAPNPKNWTFERGFVRNHELQWYQPDNARVQGGMLVVEARRERVTNPDYQAGSSDWKRNRQAAEYTSSSLLSSGLQSWKYGRFEMRARIPTSAGMWPAWWTLGQRGEWPSNGEIDVMEYYRGNILANVACGTNTRWVARWDSSTKAISSMGADWASRFHVWRMDWDDQSINLYVDDVLLNAVALESMLNADGTSPFRQPHYMIVNLAIGGDNGGDPSSTVFPARYEVDYVRVYQKN